MISGQTPTAEHGKQADFSRPYGVNRVAIFVRTGESTIGGLGDAQQTNPSQAT